MINELAIQKQVGLKSARKTYESTGRAINVEISVRLGDGWQHYVYRYNPDTNSLVQDVTE